MAVGYGLLRQGAARVEVLDADRDAAEACVARWRRASAPIGSVSQVGLEEAIADAQGVVNATPLGMHGHPGTSVPVELLRPDLWVSDVVYFPLETELVAAARARGCRVLPAAGWPSSRQSARSSTSPADRPTRPACPRTSRS